MAVQPAPLERRPGAATVTVRVRTLVVAALVLAVGAAVVAAARYVSGLAPLQAGSLATSPQSVAPVRHTDDLVDTGPPIYPWRRGARIVYLFDLRNTSHLPITI